MSGAAAYVEGLLTPIPPLGGSLWNTPLLTFEFDDGELTKSAQLRPTPPPPPFLVCSAFARTRGFNTCEAVPPVRIVAIGKLSFNQGHTRP